ncbi:Lrp/AsnC family transcriptional regulator [Bacteroidota bacterium]
MDKTDEKIISLLKANARTSNAEIARQIGIVPSAVLERIRKLEEKGIIKKYAAVTDPAKTGRNVLAYLQVSTSTKPGDRCSSECLSEFQEVVELHQVAGEYSYLLKVRTEDNQTLAKFLKDKLGALQSITSIKTTIVLETVKEGL